MNGEKRSKGKCAYCGQEIVKNTAVKHLALCRQRQEAIAKANNKKGETEALYHLRVHQKEAILDGDTLQDKNFKIFCNNLASFYVL